MIPALDAIKARAGEFYCPDCYHDPSHKDVPQLVAALEAVLAIPKAGTDEAAEWDYALDEVHQVIERVLKEEQ